MVVDGVCSRGGGNITTRAAHMSSGTRLRCRSIARSSHGPRRAVGQQGGRSVSNRRRGGAGLTTFFILCESGGTCRINELDPDEAIGILVEQLQEHRGQGWRPALNLNPGLPDRDPVEGEAYEADMRERDESATPMGKWILGGTGLGALKEIIGIEWINCHDHAGVNGLQAMNDVIQSHVVNALTEEKLARLAAIQSVPPLRRDEPGSRLKKRSLIAAD